LVRTRRYASWPTWAKGSSEQSFVWKQLRSDVGGGGRAEKIIVIKIKRK